MRIRILPPFLALAAGAVLLLAWRPAAAPRNDAWTVLGPGGGGSIYAPTISPHDTSDVLLHCDMTGSYISHDGGSSWRMFNLRGRARFYLWDPLDANVVYVQTTALWRSADRGNTWRLVYPDPAGITGIRMPDDHAGEIFLSHGEPAPAVTALAVDPADSKTLYAAFREPSAAVLRVSTDTGKTWRDAGAIAGGAQKLFVDPRSSRADRTIYAIGGNSVAVREHGAWRTGARPEGVEAFTDTAAGWASGGGPLVIYATSPAGGFVSEDGGRSWRAMTLPVPVRVNSSGVAASLLHGETAYVSYDNGRNPAERIFGVARTTNRGRTWELAWTQADTRPPRNREAWMTERNGEGWGRNPENLGVAPTDPNLVFGSDSMRAMRSRDGGRTWEAVYSARVPGAGWESTGLDVTTCYGVHFDPFDPRRMLISYTDIGQYRSEDGGRSWLLSTEGIPREWRNTTYWVVYDPAVKGRLWGVMSYVHDLPRPKMWAAGRSPLTYVGGICRSDDGAQSWKCLDGAIPQTAPTHIVMDPRSPAGRRVLYVAGFGRGVYKSEDDGAHWTLRNTGISGAEPLAWRFAQDREGALYLVVARRTQDGSIGNDGDGALYRSTDGAAHWTKIALPGGVNGPNGLAVDAGNPRRLYLAAWGRRTAAGAVGGGVFVSDDAGATWRNVLARDQHVYDVTIDPRNPRTLYACGFESSAWRSTDRGETWERIRGYNFKWGHRVIPDPADPAKVYITTFGGSVWHGPAAGDPRAPEDIATPAVAFSR